jgi:hypothetical protein
VANGNPAFNVEYYERYFEPIAACIALLAARRNLELVKYDHESPYWDLLFAHPIGGHGKLVLGQGESQGVSLSAAVWLDDYDSFTRHVRWLNEREASRKPDELTYALDRLLDEVLTWRLDEQFRAVSGYQSIWSKLSREQFLAMQPTFPLPTSGKT